MLSRAPAHLDRVHEWAEVNLRPFWFLAPAGLLTVGYLAMVAWSWQHTSYDVWGAMLIAPLLIALTVPMTRRVAHEERDRAMSRIIIGGLVAKLLFTLVRYGVAYGVYGGAADANGYHAWGALLAPGFRAGVFDTFEQPLTNTGFIRVFTGFVYTITGPSKLGGFVIFSWLGFWGLYFFYRAFRIAVPTGDHRRYAYLVLFLPSMLYWPSSIGKEAWMCLMLGLSALGTAKILRRIGGGFPVAALGIAGCAIVRPHVALLVFVGLAVAYLIGDRPSKAMFGALTKGAGIVLLVAVGFVLVGQVEEFFEVQGLEEGGAESVLTEARLRSGQGGSEFATVDASSPTGFVRAVITVLFRPFPQEAGNIQGMLAAVEGLAVLVIVALATPRIIEMLRRPRRSGFGVFSTVYTVLFCWAFSNIGNFGILTRQRVQVLPFLLVLTCLPRRGEVREADVARS